MIALLLLASLAWPPVGNPTYESAKELAQRLEVAPGWTCEVGERYTYCCTNDFKLEFDKKRGWLCRYPGDSGFVAWPTRTKRFRGDSR